MPLLCGMAEGIKSLLCNCLFGGSVFVRAEFLNDNRPYDKGEQHHHAARDKVAPVTSSKPPSTDGFKKAPKSLREKSGKKRGRVKRGKILALIDRLQKHKGAVCLFLEKISVPFDNNQAERDIRNIKTKTKVCGCFRSRTGAEEYMGLMSFISTARKNGIDSYHAVKMALLGQNNHILCIGC